MRSEDGRLREAHRANDLSKRITLLSRDLVVQREQVISLQQVTFPPFDPPAVLFCGAVAWQLRGQRKARVN